MAGAVACGADLVYMGTGFIATTESMAASGFKQMVVDSTVDDIVISAGITGTAASWLAPSLRANGLDPAALPDAPARNYDSSQDLASKRWKDVWAAGQGLGAIKAIEPVAAVVDRLEREYREARARFERMV